MTFMNVRMIKFVEITNSGVIAPLWALQLLETQNIMNGVYERLNPFTEIVGGPAHWGSTLGHAGFHLVLCF